MICVLTVSCAEKLAVSFDSLSELFLSQCGLTKLIELSLNTIFNPFESMAKNFAKNTNVSTIAM